MGEPGRVQRRCVWRLNPDSGRGLYEPALSVATARSPDAWEQAHYACPLMAYGSLCTCSRASVAGGAAGHGHRDGESGRRQRLDPSMSGRLASAPR